MSPLTLTGAGLGGAGGPASVNLVPNGSFEREAAGAAPLGWTRLNGDESVVASAFAGGVGTKAVAIGNGLTQSHNIIQSVASAVTPGVSYKVAAAFKQISVTGGQLFVTIQWFDASAALISLSSGAVDTGPGLNATGVVSVTATAPVGAVTAKVKIDKGFNTTQYHVDAIMFAPAAQGITYADGDTPGWVWNGTAGNSTSRSV